MPIDPSPYGVNAHLAIDPMLRTLAEAGARWIRIDIDWSRIEPRQGSRDWGEVDRVVRTAGQLGLSVLASIAYLPSWASRDGRTTGAPRDPGAWAGFVAEAVGRLAHGLAAVSVGNEPNLKQFYTGSRDEYLRDLLLPGLAAAQAAAPTLLRCGPDLSSSPSGGDPLRNWLAPCLDRAGDRIDVIAHHQYDGHDSVGGRVGQIDALHEFLERRDDTRPIWITEIGWDTRSGVSPETQGAQLRGVLQGMAGRAWWQKTFWYDSHGAGWGLLEPDTSARRGEPRPALRALAQATGGGQPAPAGIAAEDAQVLVEHAYRGVLGREPDVAGLEAWSRLLHAGASIDELCRALFESAEFQAQRASRSGAALTFDLYAGILEREADPAGGSEALADVTTGRLGQRAVAMLASDEFRERFLGQA